MDGPAVVVALSSAGLIVAYRIAIRAGFGFDDQRAMRPLTGFLANRYDNLTYASWAVQAAAGRWLFADPYTLSPHLRAYFNPFFLVVGIISRMTGIPVPAVLIMAGIAASAVTVYAVFLVAEASGVDATGARWAASFAAFGSGLSGLVTVLHGRLVTGADWDYAESIFSSSFYIYPYHTCAYALLALTAACAISLAAGRRDRTIMIGSVVLSAALAATHPYEMVMLIASLLGSALIAWIVGPRTLVRRRLLATSLCTIGAAPFLLYAGWLSRQPVWAHLAASGLANAQPRVGWVLGYGVPGMLAMVGSCRAAVLRDGIDLDWALTWIVLLVIILVIVAAPQTKVACGGYLPIAVGAGATMGRWGERFGRRHRLPWAFARGGILGVSVSSFAFLLAYLLRPQPVDRGLLRLAYRLGESGAQPATVLAPTDAGSVLPALANVRVYAGNWSLTDAYQDRTARLRASGFEPSRDSTGSTGSEAPSKEAFERLVREVHPQFVILRRGRAALGFAKHSHWLRGLECHDRWCIIRAPS